MSSATPSLIEQRFLPRASLWSGTSCLVSVMELGPLAHALTADVPGLDQQLLSLLPGLQDYAEPLRRGAYFAEVLALVAVALQRIAGDAPAARPALVVQGRNGRVSIIVGGRDVQRAMRAFALAGAIVGALWAGKAAGLRRRIAAFAAKTDSADGWSVPKNHRPRTAKWHLPPAAAGASGNARNRLASAGFPAAPAPPP